MSFTVKEKQAAQSQHYHFGDISSSQIQIASSGSSQRYSNVGAMSDIDALKGFVSAFGDVLAKSQISSDVVEELKAELATLRAQAKSPRPKWEVIRMTARAIKSVAEGAAGNILGELAAPHVQTLFALAASSVG